jgi:hypothetical protein
MEIYAREENNDYIIEPIKPLRRLLYCISTIESKRRGER